jgi:hypothetical protein
MQPGSRPSGRERPIRVADVEGSSPAFTILDSGIEGKDVLPIWSSRIRHQPGMEGTAAWEASHTRSVHVHYMACDAGKRERESREPGRAGRWRKTCSHDCPVSMIDRTSSPQAPQAHDRTQ